MRIPPRIDAHVYEAYIRPLAIALQAANPAASFAYCMVWAARLVTDSMTVRVGKESTLEFGLQHEDPGFTEGHINSLTVFATGGVIPSTSPRKPAE
jgi:hypothetical protein